MSVHSISPRAAPEFTAHFPAERAKWERSINSGATWFYNPPAAISHPNAAPAATERYRLRFKIPAGIIGTIIFEVSGDKWDGGGTGGSVWLDGIQYNANTGTGSGVNTTTINNVGFGSHVFEWRHGTWTGFGKTIPVINFYFTNTSFI